METKRQQYFKFSEREVINVMDCVLSALVLLSFKGLHHHNLSLSTILVREVPKKYVLTYPPLCCHHLNNPPREKSAF